MPAQASAIPSSELMPPPMIPPAIAVNGTASTNAITIRTVMARRSAACLSSSADDDEDAGAGTPEGAA